MKRYLALIAVLLACVTAYAGPAIIVYGGSSSASSGGGGTYADGGSVTGWQLALDCDLTSVVLVDGGLTLDMGTAGSFPDGGGTTYSFCGTTVSYAGSTYATDALLQNDAGWIVTTSTAGTITLGEYPQLLFYLNSLIPKLSQTTSIRTTVYGGPISCGGLDLRVIAGEGADQQNTSATNSALFYYQTTSGCGGNPFTVAASLNSSSPYCSLSTSQSPLSTAYPPIAQVTHLQGITSPTVSFSMGSGTPWPIDDQMGPFAYCVGPTGTQNLSALTPVAPGHWSASAGAWAQTSAQVIVIKRIRIEYHP